LTLANAIQTSRPQNSHQFPPYTCGNKPKSVVPLYLLQEGIQSSSSPLGGIFQETGKFILKINNNNKILREDFDGFFLSKEKTSSVNGVGLH